jgi:putative membrane protein
MLYAGLFVTVPAPSAQIQRGAELMYYGGDIAEMLLAFALVSTWHPVRKRLQGGAQNSPFPNLIGVCVIARIRGRIKQEERF